MTGGRLERQDAMHDVTRTLSFEREGHRHAVWSSIPIHGGSLAGSPAGGVAITKGGERVAELRCEGEPKGALEELAAVVRQPGPRRARLG